MTTNKFLLDINIVGDDDFICYNIHDGIMSFNHEDVIEYMKSCGVLSSDYNFNEDDYENSLIYLLDCFDDLCDEDNKFVFINNYGNIQKLMALVMEYEH